VWKVDKVSFNYSKDQTLKVQVAERMKKLIESGEWQPGDSVGDVMKLADRFEVSFGTVRAAEEILVQEGWLDPIRPGIPTRVAQRQHNEPDLREVTAQLAALRDQLGAAVARLEQLAS
jgi:DNA-binding FadR family transcriptional regulator